ncbi:PilW family protein [Aeromonas sanarellii]
MLRSCYARGFSLVELLIAMVAGLLLVAAAISLFVTVLKAESTAMKVSRLNQELQSVVDMIARDVQRAGYDAGSAAMLNAASGARSLFYFDSTTDLASDCIRVKYDDDGDGSLGSTEIRRYNYDSAGKTVRLDTGSAASCTAGNNISTEDTIEVTALSFTPLTGSLSSGARTVQLSISGRDKGTPALNLTLQRDIKLRNDGY